MEKFIITTTNQRAGVLLELARKKADQCMVTANYYQMLPKKAHLWERWLKKYQEWNAIAADLEAAALAQ